MIQTRTYSLLIFDWEGTLMNVTAPFEGVVNVLTSLRESGYLLAIATGKSRRGLEQDLALFDLTSLFSTWRCGDDGFTKPHPQMIEDILDFLDVSPKQALMIGDTPADLYMAQAAHIDSLAVSYGLESKQSLLSLNPGGCIDDIIELPSWLKNH